MRYFLSMSQNTRQLSTFNSNRQIIFNSCVEGPIVVVNDIELASERNRRQWNSINKTVNRFRSMKVKIKNETKRQSSFSFSELWFFGWPHPWLWWTLNQSKNHLIPLFASQNWLIPAFIRFICKVNVTHSRRRIIAVATEPTSNPIVYEK